MAENYEIVEKYFIETIKNYEFHCPEGFEKALFEIKHKKNKIYIKYKCRKEHKGEILIEKFFENQNYSINTLLCYYCNKLVNNLNYCYECEKPYCQGCKLKHLIENHKKIFKIIEYNKICPKHSNYYRVFCESCKLLLCEKCPSFHINHELSKKSIFVNDEKIEELKKQIEIIENERNKLINEIKSYILRLKNKLKEFSMNTQFELQFIKNMIDSYNNKNKDFINYELCSNINKLKLKNLNWNSIGINEFLNKDYSIIDDYDEYETDLNDVKENNNINNK